jgi:sulfate-transporting ATPase
MNLRLDVIQGILGLGPGAIYALLGLGLIVIYRGSGVLNFSQGAMAMAGGLVYIDARERYELGFVPGLLIAVLSVAALGAVFHLVVMRRLRQASTMARTVATLGLYLLIQGGATVRWGTAPKVGVVQSLPHAFRQWHGYGISEDRLWMIAIVAFLTAVLFLVSRRTLFGLATTAVAENQAAAESLGWSADAVAAVNWALGAGLAALAGVLFAPVSGIQTAETSSLVIAALARRSFVSRPGSVGGRLAWPTPCHSWSSCW